MSKLDSVYCCDVQKNLNISLPQMNTKVMPSGNHTSGKSDENVNCFNSINKDIQYFPEGLDKSFGELKAIKIRNGSIKKINQNDLKPFTKLVNLDLSHNDIEALDDGLFDYNINLEVFFCHNNKIFFIASTAFDKLNKLSHLNLKSNVCIDKKIDDNIEAVKTAIKDSKEKCYTSTSSIYKSIETLRNEVEIYKAKFDKFLTNNEDETTRNRIEVQRNSRDVENLRQKIKNITCQSDMILTESFDNNSNSSKIECVDKIDFTEKYRSMFMMIFVALGELIQTIFFIFVYNKYLA